MAEPYQSYTFRVMAWDIVDKVGQDEAVVDVYSVVKYYAFNGQRMGLRRGGGETCDEAV